MIPQTLKIIFDELHTSESGLTSQDARQKLAQYGPNDPSGVKRRSLLTQILGMFTNPPMGQ